jgi:NAD(P)H-hydrate epimerase
MRQWEAQSWAAGCSESDVIRRAGLEVAKTASRLTQRGDRIVIVAGKGNNGADARSAQAGLMERVVEVIEASDPAAALAPLQAAIARKPALIIDGLFGIGLNRPLEADWIKLIQAINQSRVAILAVDVPSGLDADTGKLHGAAICATVTLTFGAPKRGLMAPRNWDHVGRLEVAPEIGLIPCPFEGELLWTLPEDFRGFPPRRLVGTHKGSFGHLVIVAGSIGYHGAAVLSARGAMRAQPGLITLGTTESTYGVIASQLQSPMVESLRGDWKLPDYANALMFGPGLAGPNVTVRLRYALRRAWENAAVPVVVDATGLEFIRPEQRRLEYTRVITPHPGEAARMLVATKEAVLKDRVGAARELSRRHNDCWVVLKGHQTVIARSRGPAFVNSSGNPGLAQGGSGDLLAGFLAGFLGQSKWPDDAATALRYAVWEHGAAADRLAARWASWTIEDLAEELGRGGAR